MIKQAKDIYTWRAVYEDEVICEENVSSFADVDLSQVKDLQLYPLQGSVSHHVAIPQGSTPIFFRRRSVEINPLAGESTPRPTVHCIGWKRGDEATYLFCFDDGSTLLTDNLQAV